MLDYNTSNAALKKERLLTKAKSFIFTTQSKTQMTALRNFSSLVLFQYGAVHEEIAPSILSACNSLNHKVTISLHQGSLKNKGNVFDAFKPDSLKGHNIIYRTSGSQVAEPGRQLEDLVFSLDRACVLFLTLQNPWTVEIAERLQSKGVKVAGVIHNIDKVCKDQYVLSYWKKSSTTPIVLSSHVQSSLADQIQRHPDDISVLYSTFQPEANSEPLQDPLDNKIRIAISGSINYNTRPFGKLIRALTNLKEKHSPILDRLVFHLLGGGTDRARLISEVEEHRLSANFHFANVNAQTGRSAYGEYYHSLSKCHYVLILDHDAYTTQKITSAVPTCISFLKPVIASNKFISTYELHGAGIEADDLQSALCNITSQHQWLDQIQRLREIRAKQLQGNVQLVQRIVDQEISPFRS
jgi:hypothetical protein